MAARQLVDPAGVQWRVRRRWYPWRRALPLRDTWNSSTGSSEPSTPSEPMPEAAAEEDSELPRNLVLRVLLIVLAGLVWVCWGALKVLAYTVAALVFVALSLLEWVLELVLMPFVVVLRLFGVARWPVEIARQGKHFATKYAPNLAEAATLQDELAARLESGSAEQLVAHA